MDPLRIIPLGGLGEIGMNLMLYEYEGAVIAVDCGMMFPDAATLGVDVIVPDMTYLFEQPGKLRAVFLTHGHEDHIGAVPFLVERLNVPVYGMPLALGFVEDKLEEFGVEAELREIQPRDVIEVGPFSVEAIRVTDGPDVEPGRGQRLLDRVRREVLLAKDQLGGSMDPAVGIGRQRRERVVVTLTRAKDEVSLHGRLNCGDLAGRSRDYEARSSGIVPSSS